MKNDTWREGERDRERYLKRAVLDPGERLLTFKINSQSNAPLPSVLLTTITDSPLK